MRKLKLQVQMTIDGFICGSNGEMDFISFNWGDDIKEYVENLTETIDCIVLGRKLAQGFIPHWKNVASDSTDPDFLSGKKFTNTHKVVFSKTLENSEWENTVVANGDIVEEINKLKKQDGADIIVYGGANFVSSLIKNSLIDELHLFINPTAIGKGLSIFKDLESNQKFNLVKSQAFDCGIVVLKYSL